MSELSKLARVYPSAYTREVRSVAAPAAGADFSLIVPGGQVWLLRSVVATLVTSAAVANRQPRLTVDDSTTIAAQYVVGAVQAAGATVRYAWMLGYPVLMAAAEQGLVNVPIGDHALQPGWRARPVTTNLDAADQWSAITFEIDRLDKPSHVPPMFGTVAATAWEAAMAAAGSET